MGDGPFCIRAQDTIADQTCHIWCPIKNSSDMTESQNIEPVYLVFGGRYILELQCKVLRSILGSEEACRFQPCNKTPREILHRILWDLKIDRD